MSKVKIYLKHIYFQTLSNGRIHFEFKGYWEVSIIQIYKFIV